MSPSEGGLRVGVERGTSLLGGEERWRDGVSGRFRQRRTRWDRDGGGKTRGCFPVHL